MVNQAVHSSIHKVIVESHVMILEIFLAYTFCILTILADVHISAMQAMQFHQNFVEIILVKN